MGIGRFADIELSSALLTDRLRASTRQGCVVKARHDLAACGRFNLSRDAESYIGQTRHEDESCKSGVHM